MRLRVLVFALLLVSCKDSADGSPSTTASVSAGREQDDAAVRAAFAAYTEQGMAKKGEAVAGLVSRSTFAHYEQMRDAALTEPAADLRRRSLAERAQVLTMRRDVPAGKLHESSGRELLIHAIDAEGLADDANTHKITKVRFVGDNEALASMMIQGNPAPDALRVVREDGAWKVEPHSLLQMANQFFKNAIDSGQMTEKQALHMILGEDDDAVVERLFEPLVER